MKYDLQQHENTLTSYIKINTIHLNTLKTKEEMQEFLNAGIIHAQTHGHLSDEMAAKIKLETEPLTAKKLQFYIWNTALAGAGLKTIKIV
jgi:hypothetical protein